MIARIRLKPNILDRRANAFALFLYATIIVDIYRKIDSNVVALPFDVSIFRNFVYICLFVYIFINVREKGALSKLAIISVVFVLITIFSYLINPYSNTLSLYVAVLLMFFSRLLPAYYIGRYMGEEEQETVLSRVNALQWIALAYTVLILMYPETAIKSYMTISNNLLVVTLLCLFRPAKGKMKLITYAICVLSLIVIVIYGGRGSLVSVMSVFALWMLINQGKNRTTKTIAGIVIISIVTIGFIIFYQQIAEILLDIYPNSRTLELMASGKFLWDSNRSYYYEAAVHSLINNPFKIYGFLGDRFYFAEYFGSSADYTKISTMFAHNVFLEVLLNFGVIIGCAIIIPIIVKTVSAFRYITRSRDKYSYIIFIVVFGSVFVNMIVSFSYLNEYTIWLLVGLIMNYAKKRRSQIESSEQKVRGLKR